MVLMLQETLVPKDGWCLRLRGYQVIHHPCEGTSLRGVALAFANGISSVEIPGIPGQLVMGRCFDFEQKTSWIFGSLYAPSAAGPARQEFYAALKHRLESLCRSGDPICIGGDFNVPYGTLVKRIASWGLPLAVLKASGSRATRARHGRFSAIDHFLVNWTALDRLGPMRVKRLNDLSDHWPIFTARYRKPEDVDMGTSTVHHKRVCAPRLKGFQADIIHDNRWAALADLPDIPQTPESLEDAMSQFLQASDQVLSDLDVYVEPSPKPWRLPKHIDRALRHKNACYRAWLKSHGSRRKARLWGKYERARARALALLKDYKRSQWDKFIRSGTDHFVNQEPRSGWKWVKALTGDNCRSSSVTPVRDESGALLLDPAEVRIRWKAHHSSLAADPTGHSRDKSHWRDRLYPRVSDKPLHINDPITWPELVAALKSMRNGKAPGVDGLPPEFYKLLLNEQDKDFPSSGMARALYKLWSGLWQAEYIPQAWRSAIIVNVPKPGDATVTDNYRGISLIAVGLKVLSVVVIRRISSALEDRGFFSESQAGFRAREECVAQAIALRSLVQQRLGRGLPTYAAFIDIRKAYDTVPIEALLTRLEEVGVTGRCLSWLRFLYTHSDARVRVGSYLTEAFEVRRGVRQGCPMSPTLFNIFINDILYGCTPHGVPIGSGVTIPGLLFADDLVLVAPTPENLQASLDWVSQWALYNEMSFGIKKCGTMVFDQLPLPRLSWTLMDTPLPAVDSYTYLGVEITPNLSLDKWLACKVNQARRVTAKLLPVLTCQSIPVPIRVLIVRTLIESRLRYGCELIGSNSGLSSSLQSSLAAALKLVLGSPRSKNTVVASTVLFHELDIPTIAASASVAMCRAYQKYRTLPTFISKIIRLPDGRYGPRTWGSLVRRWVKKHKLSLDTPFETLKSQILEIHLCSRLRHDKTSSLAKYQERKLDHSRSYLTLSLAFPEFSKGFTWLCRLRLDAIWTGQRAARAGLIPPIYMTHCVSCSGLIPPGISHISHFLTSCPAFFRERETSGLAVLIHEVRRQFSLAVGEDILDILLLGGDSRGLTLGSQWDGSMPHWPSTWPYPYGAVIVAAFAQLACPVFVGHVWKNRLETSGSAVAATT